MNSEVVRVLLEVFSNPDEQLSNNARSAFLEVFMGRTVSKKPKTTTADSPATPFSILIHKLQDLLSRSEHFEVTTVHQGTFDGNRSSAASMLAKQIRLKLQADDDSDIPRSYRSIMVSIHAIATFKALDDYLRPRISAVDRPRGSRNREGISGAFAALAAAGIPNPYGAAAAQARLAERAMASSTPATPAAPTPTTSRSSKKAKSKSTPSDDSALGAPSNDSTTPEKSTVRRSSRRSAAQSEPPAPPPPMQEDDSLADALECADERQLMEDEDMDDMDDSTALDTIVGDLEEDMEEDSATDPTAVNLEVAAGGKVTARKEDGTRVATPSQAPGSNPRNVLAASAQATQATPSTSTKPMSYAAAAQAIPQDWHIEFSLDDKVIGNETTIYRAVHQTSTTLDEHASRSVWSAIHPIKFKRVRGPPLPEPSSLSQAAEVSTETTASGLPASLDKHPATSSILRLLNILHALNANLDDVLAENKETLKLNIEPLSQFVNTKLTAKLNRQLEEPLIVASNCLPSWSEDLARLYPFLFPFETRHLFLQSTSFGYARSMTRWQNAQSADESRRDRHRDERYVQFYFPIPSPVALPLDRPIERTAF
jgi:E3 ubiquitin-protein ligase TRIP12